MAEPAKEALFVLIDVSETMRPHLGDAKDAMAMLVNQKILFHKQDVVGVATMGSVATDNKVQARSTCRVARASARFLSYRGETWGLTISCLPCCAAARGAWRRQLRAPERGASDGSSQLSYHFRHQRRAE